LAAAVLGATGAAVTLEADVVARAVNGGMVATGHAMVRGRWSSLYSDSDLWEDDGLPGIPTADASYNASGGVRTRGATTLCEDGEERFLLGCYKTCGALTDGEFPARFAPNGCCKELSISCLNPADVRVSMPWPGHGMMVGGDGKAPHPPGECDPDEEGLLGLCFKKCSILTQNEYPIRAATNTCCKRRPCANLLNLKTKGVGCNGFGVGGGAKGHECPHKRTYNKGGSRR